MVNLIIETYKILLSLISNRIIEVNDIIILVIAWLLYENSSNNKSINFFLKIMKLIML